MPVFEYEAIKVSGDGVQGILTADSPRQARDQLRNQDLFVTGLKAVDDVKKRVSLWKLRNSLSTRRLRVVGLMSRQLATMLGSGLPLTEVLNALVEQSEDKRFSRVLREVREKVTRGCSLADALEEHPEYFNRLYIGMVRAGEASGRLDEVLAKVAEFCQRDYRMQSRISAILTYPCVILVVGVGVVLFLLAFVVPHISGVFLESRVPLPTSTVILIAISNFLQERWFSLSIAMGVFFMALKAFSRTDSGRWFLDSLLLKVPILGTLFRKQAIARFASTLAALLRSGLPALDALDIVRGVVGNKVLARAIEQIAEAVTAGQDMSTPLRASKVFPPMVSYMVATGEQSGALDELLDKVAEELDEEVDLTGQRLISLLEPMIIIVIAVLVAFVLLAIIQPILELSNF